MTAFGGRWQALAGLTVPAYALDMAFDMKAKNVITAKTNTTNSATPSKPDNHI
jgi:hypothetical protein